jgi:hypothetical protein
MHGIYVKKKKTLPYSIACWVTNVGFSLPLTYMLLSVRFSVLNRLHHYILVLHIYTFLGRGLIIIIMILIIIIIISIIIIIIIDIVVITVAAADIRCKDWPDVTTSRGRQQVPQQTPHAL